MSGQVVFSEDRHFMGMMPQNRRSPLAKLVIAGQNGVSAASAVDLERRIINQRTRIITSSRKAKRSLRTRIHPHKYTLLRTSKKELKVSRRDCRISKVLLMHNATSI